MIYASIDVSLQGHARAIEAGPAMYLWTYAMLWSRDQKESGLVPKRVLLRSTWGEEAGNAEALTKLISSGLFLDRGESVEIRNYQNKNDSREVIERRIKEARDRQARARSKRTNEHAHVTRDSHVSPGVGVGVGVDHSSEGERERGRPRPLTCPADDGVLGASVDAFGEGITAVTGRPTTRLSQADVRTMLDVCNAHAPGIRGKPLVEWVRKTASEFAAVVDGTYRKATPKHLAAWLDAGKPPKDAKPSGTYRKTDILQRAPDSGPLWKIGEVIG